MSESPKRAKAKYKAEKTKRFTLEFSPADMDLFEHIQQQPLGTKQTYIKNLIREDIKKEQP